MNRIESPMPRHVFSLFVVMQLCAATAFATAAATRRHGQSWPGWRRDGSGLSGERDLPTRWDAHNGVAWKTGIAGEGSSSPIVWDDRVFVTASTQGGRTRLVICLDAATGKTLWQTPLEADATNTYPRAGRAPATPVADGRHVYAFFDSPGLIALDHSGRVQWTAALGPFNNPYNMASSPILCDDLVVHKCDHQGKSFIVAFDKLSGQERWRTARTGGLHYATPISFVHDGSRQIVVNALTITSYDASTGQELWSCRGMKHATTPTPLYDDGLVFATCGRNGPSVAIDPGGRGDVTDTHVRMRVASGGPYVPSPLLHQGLFVIPGDDGRIVFVNRRGRRVLRHRIRARFTGSPIAAGDRIYWTDEKARTHVLDSSTLNGPEPQVRTIAVNALGDETCYASPAVAGGRIFIRTAKHLYCITGGEAKLAAPPPIALPLEFHALKAFYMAQPVSENDDTQLRLEIVDRFARMRHPDAADMLGLIVQRDGHWDVSEAAVRALGNHGRRAVPALLHMFSKGQPFFKTVAAEQLARLKPPEAAPALIKAARKEEIQVREAGIEALGHVAEANSGPRPDITDALVDLLSDEEGRVRLASIRALVRCATEIGDRRGKVVAALRAATEDPNTLVAEEAKLALSGAFR